MQNLLKFNWVSISCFFYPILILSYGRGYNSSAILISVVALVLLFTTRKQAWHFSPQLKAGLYALLGYFAIFLLFFAYHSERASYLDRATRVFLGVLILIGLSRRAPSTLALMRGFAVAGIVAGISALICALYFHQFRAFTGNDNVFFLKNFMPIQSGDMGMTLGLLACVATLYFAQKKDWLFTLIAISGGVLGILSSILSGSRGGWVALPPIALYLLWANRKYIGWKQLTALFVAIAITFAIFGNTIYHKVERGFQKADQDITLYDNDNTNSSLGVRFTLWKNALLIIQDAPIMGVSKAERLALGMQHLAEGKISLNKRNEAFLAMHPHNEYLDAWTLRGIPGLIALLMLFLVPLTIFYRNGRAVRYEQSEHQVAVSAINQAGIVVIIGVMIYGLSQGFFAHNSGMMFYIPMVSLLLAKSIQLREKH